MASITMCTGKGCAEKNDCYRYRAIPSPNQRWQQFDPGNTAKCFFAIRDEYRLMNTNWQDRPEFAGMMKNVGSSSLALAEHTQRVYNSSATCG